MLTLVDPQSLRFVSKVTPTDLTPSVRNPNLLPTRTQLRRIDGERRHPALTGFFVVRSFDGEGVNVV